jgi:RNA polymerase sigma-70 factor, ECF subfamily
MNRTDQVTYIEEFIETHLHKLVRHAFFRLGNLKDAEDVVQDVLIKMISSQQFGNSIGKPLAYAYRMIANSCTDRYRLAERRNNCSLDEITDHLIETIGNKESEIIRQEEFNRIYQLLNSIPQEQSDVLRYKIVDGLTFPEITEILGLPLTTVKSRFKYGLDKIKNQFFMRKEVTHEL